MRVLLHDRAYQRFVPASAARRRAPGRSRARHARRRAGQAAGWQLVQVNGDVILPLNCSQVETALRRAAPLRAHSSSRLVIAAPVNFDKVRVTIRQRRRLPARADLGETADDSR